jgi:hypothetical protein
MKSMKREGRWQYIATESYQINKLVMRTRVDKNKKRLRQQYKQNPRPIGWVNSENPWRE